MAKHQDVFPLLEYTGMCPCLHCWNIQVCVPVSTAGIYRYSTANADPVFSAFPRREVNLFRIRSPQLFIAGLGGTKFLPRRDNLPVVGTSLF
jgi:hypothetical protein